MGLTIISKYISSGSQIKSNVVNLSSIAGNSWRDDLSVDSVSVGVNNMWTPTTGGTGAITPDQPSRYIMMETPVNADAATLTSVFTPESHADYASNFSFRVQITTGAIAASVCTMGLYIDAANYVFIRNLTATTWELVSRNTAGGDGAEHTTGPFTHDFSVTPALVRIQYTDARVIVYIDDEPVADYTSLTEIPAWNVGFFRFYSQRITASVDMVLYGSIVWERTMEMI